MLIGSKNITWGSIFPPGKIIRTKKVLSFEELEAIQKRSYVARLVFLKISERMRSRPERVRAEARRRMRAARKANMPVKHKSMGIVDDSEYGEKEPRMGLSEARVKLCL